MFCPSCGQFPAVARSSVSQAGWLANLMLVCAVGNPDDRGALGPLVSERVGKADRAI